jgi:hypothetical protein
VSEAEQSMLCWRKSSKSAATNCVEVATLEGAVLVRDSKDPHGPVMRFSTGDWARFVALITSAAPDEETPVNT